MIVDSSAWTGRQPGLGLRYRMELWAWPAYECEQCVGQEPWRGCWCEYHGASGPGVGPERWRVALRWAWWWLGISRWREI